MESPHPLDRLLAFLDRLTDVQDRCGGTPVATEERARLASESLPMVEEVMPVLIGGDKDFTFDVAEGLVLALFFHRRTLGRREAVHGSEIVGLLAAAGLDRSLALEMLSTDSRLRREGWLRWKIVRDGHDPLDCAFGPTPKALRVFWSPPQKEDSSSTEEIAKATPYLSESDYLWDLFEWRNLCLKRCQALLPADGGPQAGSQALTHACRTSRQAQLLIRSRLGATAGGRHYAMESFRREHSLGQDHLLVVVHLLASEFLEAEPYVSALECLRLVCENRNDLFAKRKLFQPKSRLRRSGMILADGPDEAKSLATNLTLADWAGDQLLAGVLASPRLQDEALDRFLRD